MKNTIISLLVITCLTFTLFAEKPSIAVKLEQLINEKGVEEAVKICRNLQSTAKNEYSFEAKDLRNLAMKLFQKRDIKAVRAVVFLNAEFNPESSIALRDLARIYLMEENMDKARESFAKSTKYSPVKNIADALLQKQLFFVSTDFIAPVELKTDKFLVVPLREKHTESDYKAVMSSIEHIQKSIGSKRWPTDKLTLEQNRASLIRHEAQFRTKIQFTYTVLKPDSSEVIGCIYIKPSRLDDYNAEITYWTTKAEFDKGTDELLLAALKPWVKENFPFKKSLFTGRDISFEDFITKLKEQDKRYK